MKKYTEKEIEWALEEIKKKSPKFATREQAIKLLDMFGSLGDFVVAKIRKDKESGKLNPKN